MTKKHFDEMAKIFAHFRAEMIALGTVCPWELTSAYGRMLERFSSFATVENPRFDSQRFEDAIQVLAVDIYKDHHDILAK